MEPRKKERQSGRGTRGRYEGVCWEVQEEQEDNTEGADPKPKGARMDGGREARNAEVACAHSAGQELSWLSGP